MKKEHYIVFLFYGRNISRKNYDTTTTWWTFPWFWRIDCINHRRKGEWKDVLCHVHTTFLRYMIKGGKKKKSLKMLCIAIKKTPVTFFTTKKWKKKVFLYCNVNIYIYVKYARILCNFNKGSWIELKHSWSTLFVLSFDFISQFFLLSFLSFYFIFV